MRSLSVRVGIPHPPQDIFPHRKFRAAKKLPCSAILPYRAAPPWFSAIKTKSTRRAVPQSTFKSAFCACSFMVSAESIIKNAANRHMRLYASIASERPYLGYGYVLLPSSGAVVCISVCSRPFKAAVRHSPQGLSSRRIQRHRHKFCRGCAARKPLSPLSARHGGGGRGFDCGAVSAFPVRRCFLYAESSIARTRPFSLP